MKIVVIGCGKVGGHLIDNLVKEGHDCVAVDVKPSLIEELVNRNNCMGVVGNGATLITQREAGCDGADLVIAVTANDEVNMLCCTIAKKLGAKYTVTRVRNNEYAEQVDFLQDQLDFDLAINPDLETAMEITALLNIPASLQCESFWKGKAYLVEVPIDNGSVFDNMLIQDCPSLNCKFLVCAVRRGNELFIPNGSFVLRAGDVAYVIGAMKELTKLFKKLGLYKDKPHNVMIIGGSRTAAYLAETLLDNSMQVKLIEVNRQRCEQLAETNKRVEIIHGDAANQSLLISEGVAYMDAVVTLTNIDEFNIMLALYAKKQGVGKTVCKVNNSGFLQLFRDTEASTAVSPKETTSNHLLRYARAMQNSFGKESVLRLYRIAGGYADAAEFAIDANSPLVGKKLKNVRCKENTLIACVKRGTVVIIPSGDDEIKDKDNIIVVSKEHFSSVNDIYLGVKE